VVDSNQFTAGRPWSVTAVLAAKGDTTLVADFNASSFLVVDQFGKVVRTIAAPKAGDMSYLSSSGGRTAYVDPAGRLVYRGVFPAPDTRNAEGLRTTVAPDSFPIVRADFNTRAVDTIITTRQRDGTRGNMTRNAEGRMTSLVLRQPYPTIDDWTMLPDGTIAIVRGSDYHIDWLAPDGTRSSSPKMPFDWLRITDAEKTRIVDSLTRMNDSVAARNAARTPASATSITYLSGVVPTNEIPDYFPPLRPEGGSVRADPDGNLWILPTTSASARGGLTYDVVNRKGEIFERVQLPPQCALGGLGPKGTVFIICENKRLEKRRVMR
jgi:hypothetical protein